MSSHTAPKITLARPASPADVGSGTCLTAEKGHGLAQSLRELQDLLVDEASELVPKIVLRSATMRDVIQQARLYAKRSATVLLTGENGTGKELIAKLMHYCGPRASEPYVCVNCAALSETLVESELFGHQRGAFTGALDSRIGRLAEAQRGTLLLDEISEIPLQLQAKLLRVLEEMEYQPVGSNQTFRVDARVIATTNRSLENEIASGSFRVDLYYRLNVLQIHMPPLRERPDDIELLAEHFVDLFREEGDLPVTGIDPQAMNALTAAHWPGNVRQLRNVVYRACVLSRGGLIQLNDLPPLTDMQRQTTGRFEDMCLEDVERHLVLAAIQRFGGSRKHAAEHLEVNSKTIANKLQRYGILVPDAA